MSKPTNIIAPDQMTPDQLECYKMLCDIVGGAHHIDAPIHDWGDGICVNVNYASYFATYDFNWLTRAVIMAHDRAIRFEVGPGGPQRLALIFHKRQREGTMSQRHPTIEDAIEKVRNGKPSA